MTGATTFAALRVRAALFVLASGLVWLSLWTLTQTLPYVENGGAVVGQEKWAVAGKGSLFPQDAAIRVLSFGNSKVLAGLRPSTFEQALGPGVAAVNLAIPGDDRFVDLLAVALRAGNRPTHVLIQTPPQAPQRQGLLGWLRDDKRIVNTLVPFRTYVRDLVIFLYESRSGGGVQAQYASNRLQVERLRLDKGYYFIKSQSHYPRDRLPDDYVLPTDTPATPKTTDEIDSSGEWRRLVSLAHEYGFTIVQVPVAFRVGQFAPPGPSTVSNLGTEDPRFLEIGPPYWLYPPREFSDPVHLNPEGATRYSTELANLFAHHVLGRN